NNNYKIYMFNPNNLQQQKIYRELLKMPEDRSESVKTLIMDSSTWRLGEKELSIIQILSGFA
ncbi:MAG: hypothetical protein QF829_04220, partial [Candidatus Hydrothermarchaeota archaeon]|nr:hypothetical protein [Candidatus Hydrothermarchaeota archaeon]